MSALFFFNKYFDFSHHRGLGLHNQFRFVTIEIEDVPNDNYNRSFVGYAPEGQAPLQNIKPLMDWNRIILK